MANKTLCPTCKAPATLRINLKLFCSIDCAVSWSKLQADKSKAKKQKEFNAETRQRKQKLKTGAEWKSEAQALFNKMRRLEELLWFKERGIEPYCISCQLPLGNDQWCCGHFKTRKARPDLSFDKNNTFLQHNHRCNQQLSGDIEGYKIGLAFRFGEAKAREVIEYCEAEKKTPKRSADDWQQMKKEFSAEIRRLQRLL